MTLTTAESKQRLQSLEQGLQEGVYMCWEQGKQIVAKRNAEGKTQFAMIGKVRFQSNVPSYELAISRRDTVLQSGEFLLETEEDIQKMFMCFGTFRQEASVND